MLRMAHTDTAPGAIPTPVLIPFSHVPYLKGSGDLGPLLRRLMIGLEKFDKIARGEQLCSCGGGGKMDNAATLDGAAHPLTADVYAALTGVLAACGRVDAAALVQGFRTPSEPAACPLR